MLLLEIKYKNYTNWSIFNCCLIDCDVTAVQMLFLWYCSFTLLYFIVYFYRDNAQLKVIAPELADS